MSDLVSVMARWIADAVGVPPQQLLDDACRRWPQATDDEIDAALDLAADLARADGEALLRLAARIEAGETLFTADELRLWRLAQGSGAAND